MLVLGIESTCDETGCAIVRDGKEVLANLISSQIEVHTRFGGVVPELASRRHVDVLPSLLREALDLANVSLSEIDLIAVAKGPGLIGALLVGLHFAKGLSLSTGIPLLGVNHVEAHLYASFMGADVPLPAIGCVISGGHTALLYISAIGKYQLISQTHDDAIGEAFDKVALMLQLPYPGGPQIEALAKQGDPSRYPLKAGKIKGSPLDFSFSGLKTGVLYLIKGQNGTKDSPLQISEKEKCDVAASFQLTALSDVVSKTLIAANQFECKSVVVGGGVSNNFTLRHLFEKESTLPLFWPGQGLTLDNAAMIAGLGHHEYLRTARVDTLDLEPMPRIPF